MAQKITLSIPDLLHEKLKEWRSSFNFSKMFQETLIDAIHKKEEFQKRFSNDSEISDTIKRLKREKLIWEKKFFELGKIEGLRWASSAHYEDLLYVLHFDGTYKLTSDPKMTQYFDRTYQSADLAKYSNREFLEHEQMYMDGWFKGFFEFWDQIKEKI